MSDESFQLDELKRTKIKVTEPSTGADDGEPDSHPSVATNNLNINLSDNLEVLEQIGHGATGQVYKVKDKSLDQVFAVKLLRKNLLTDNQTVKRFGQEAAAAAGLSHPNVVSVYGTGETNEGSPFITMEYIDGESLSALLKRETKLDLQRAIDLFTQICDGLEHAHEKGLVHRDLKPSNIIISKSESGIETAHIVDFGIAKVVASSGDTLSTLTASGDFLGTPNYMSPEQCLGQNVDFKTDIYALGCMMFESVSGKAPYAGSSPVEVIAKKMSEASPVLQPPTVSAEVSVMVACCMASKPALRYDAAKAVKSDLVALAERREPKNALLKFGLGKNAAQKRFAAWFVDNVIVSSANGIFSFCLMIPMIILSAAWSKGSESGMGELITGLFTGFSYLVLPAFTMTLYCTLLESKRGQTLGKQLLGLSVCDLYGNKLSTKQAFLRNFYKVIFIILLPGSGLLGFTLSHHEGWGILTCGISFGVMVGMCLRSQRLYHQMPWDVWAGAQIRSSR